MEITVSLVLIGLVVFGIIAYKIKTVRNMFKDEANTVVIDTKPVVLEPKSGTAVVSAPEPDTGNLPKPDEVAKVESPLPTPEEPVVEAVVPDAKTKPAAKKEEATQDLNSMTVADLREMAKAKEISGYSSMKKAELIAALS